ncbi:MULTISPECIES: CBS domain-containing protein [Halorussus]|uniref:CBS domain-containing protein n=1 Tax=Halorussus TaxID=1070314 RepID=UPI00209FE2ED|nr:CBS domain-containing protein [Halorussus vallis]USZ76661.1 CBS domain-containing protein [Halorussus vallis]
MNVADAVTTEYVDVNPGTRLGKIRGLFDEDRNLEAILVRGDGKFDGLVTRKQLIASHHQPNEKVESVKRSAPKIERTEDVRETARLMVENELKLLPVFEDGRLAGVVTARDLLSMVHENLGALDVSDVYTQDVVSVAPETTIGEVIHTVRTHRFTRVPVVDDEEAVGMISVFDLIDFTTRQVEREQGGNSDASDSHGGGVSKSQGRTHGGWGERSGFEARLLNVPARDVMSSPAATVTPDAGLDEAFSQMLEKDYSSLVVVPEEFTAPAGIVTETDLLRALTWTEEEQMDVQIFGVSYMDDLSRESVADRIEGIDGKYEKMDVLEANVVFHRHNEKLRGTPLLQCTIRLFTDEGRFAGTGEGYGASASFDEAADKLERNVLDDKERKMPMNQVQHERERTAELLQWWRET